MGRGRLLLSLWLHMDGEQVLLQLHLGGEEQGAQGAAEHLAALGDVLAADVLLQFLLLAQHSWAEGTLHCWCF